MPSKIWTSEASKPMGLFNSSNTGGKGGGCRLKIMDKKQKLSFAKSIDADKKLITGYVSTFEWDRDNEKFVKGAWDLNQFLQNPVVLWAHNSSELPIARNVDLVEDDHGLMATSEFDSKNEFSMKVFDLFSRKFLNAFSVGFIPKNYEMQEIDGGRKGVAITEAELYEYSAVPVPANPGALVGREVAELAIKTLGKDIIEVLCTKSMGNQYLVLPITKEEKEIEGTEIKKDIPPADLEPVLKQVIELARTAKGSELPETKRGLIVTAMTVFNELLNDHQAHLEGEDLKTLAGLLSEFATVLGNIYPDAAISIQKTISQIGKAVDNGRGE